ncbi:aminotransferase-like domain-containing protein [Castellaniella caeni]|uniref:aminotransferase-like domain-containing protein n=1 Tax=Castellaniella caeni TaxID=266123 RepID=UPI000C9F1F46|nr:PLP-dependent aminotransferase family protein [Castellaniella caeni]
MDTPSVTPAVFSQRAQKLTSSAIREILKITERPEVISFAGGLPSPEGFPIPQLQAAFNQVLATQGATALQYGRTEGYTPLREWVAHDLSREGMVIDPEEVLIVSGSQQALDMLGKLFIDPGARVLVEAPSYLGALQSFSLFEPQFQAVPTDAQGLVPEALDDDITQGARFIYALPNFQNPTGLTLSLARRQALVRRCAQLGLPIIEDDPYGELRYAGASHPGLLQLGRAVGATVIRLGTFSKVLAPGMRLGYVVAPRDIISKLVQIKQATDLHTATVTQMAVYETIRDGFLQQHLPKVRELYQRQCGYMLDALKQHFPADAHWTTPEGGMFIWVTLRQGIDTTQLLQQAIAHNVAFVPGAPFYAGVKAPTNTLRLSFVTVPEAKIREGVRILGELIGPATVAAA